MQNVLQACKDTGARFVFFDNVYALGRVDGLMKEDSPLKPDSKKGQVRAQLQRMIETSGVPYIIARAADFYGPDTPLSFLNVMAFQNLAKGKKAQVFVNPDTKHSYTYTPDAGRATALLGNTPSAFGQVWHLPTDPYVPTQRQWVEQIAAVYGVKPGIQAMPKWLAQVVGLFVPAIGESVEMLYQYKYDYLFDSSKFATTFPAFGYTPVLTGIAETAAFYKVP